MVIFMIMTMSSSHETSRFPFTFRMPHLIGVTIFTADPIISLTIMSVLPELTVLGI